MISIYVFDWLLCHAVAAIVTFIVITIISLNIVEKLHGHFAPPVCSTRKPAMSFWVSSRPLDRSPNHSRGCCDELQTHTHTGQRSDMSDISCLVPIRLLLHTWLWIWSCMLWSCYSGWGWCQQGTQSAGWSRTPTGTHTPRGRTLRRNSPGSCSESGRTGEEENSQAHWETFWKSFCAGKKLFQELWWDVDWDVFVKTKHVCCFFLFSQIKTSSRTASALNSLLLRDTLLFLTENEELL